MDHIRPPGNKSEMATVRGQRAMGSWAIEVTEFNSEARCDLRGHLEATMASEATKMAVRSNMHMDTRVFEIADFKSEVKCDLRPLRPFGGYQNGCEGATKMAVRVNMHMDTRIIEVADFKS